jgi:hypothetical protein
MYRDHAAGRIRRGQQSRCIERSPSRPSALRTWPPATRASHTARPTVRRSQLSPAHRVVTWAARGKGPREFTGGPGHGGRHCGTLWCYGQGSQQCKGSDTTCGESVTALAPATRARSPNACIVRVPRQMAIGMAGSSVRSSATSRTPAQSRCWDRVDSQERAADAGFSELATHGIDLVATTICQSTAREDRSAMPASPWSR